MGRNALSKQLQRHKLRNYHHLRYVSITFWIVKWGNWNSNWLKMFIFYVKISDQDGGGTELTSAECTITISDHISSFCLCAQNTLVLKTDNTQ